MENLKSLWAAFVATLSTWLALAAKYIPIIAHRLGILLQTGYQIAARYSAIMAKKTWIVLTRLPIALFSFGRALACAEYADTLRTLQTEALPQRSRSPGFVSPPAAQLQDTPPDSALVLLSLMQKEGRLLDFLHEDITQYNDADIGAAARLIHSGCRRIIETYFTIVPICEEREGSRIVLERGFDPAVMTPTGQVVGDPPFTGTLVHRGWRAQKIQLPQIADSRDVHILAAAEVEL
jgi:hypothetical protein